GADVIGEPREHFLDRPPGEAFEVERSQRSANAISAGVVEESDEPGARPSRRAHALRGLARAASRFGHILRDSAAEASAVAGTRAYEARKIISGRCKPIRCSCRRGRPRR